MSFLRYRAVARRSAILAGVLFACAGYQCVAASVENPYYVITDNMEDFCAQRIRMARARLIAEEYGFRVTLIESVRDRLHEEAIDAMGRLEEATDGLVSVSASESIKSACVGVVLGLKSGKPVQNAAIAALVDVALRKIDCIAEAWNAADDLKESLRQYALHDEAVYLAIQHRR